MTPEELVNLLRAFAQQAEQIAALRAEVVRLTRLVGQKAEE